MLQIFIDTMITAISNSLPNMLVKQEEDDPLTLSIYQAGQPEEERRVVSLHNAWENFQRSGSTELLVNFVQGIVDFIGKSKEEILNEDMDNLIPIVRAQDASVKEHGGQKFNFINDPLANGIELLYAYDGERMITYASEYQLPQGYDIDQFKKKAKENLIKRGWQETTYKDSLPYGNLFFYDNDRQPFNAQFLLPEMYEKKIGTSFYVTFPTTEVCVVMKMHGYISAKEKDRKRALFAFASAVQGLHRTLKGALVPFIYHMQHGKISRVNF